MKPDGVFLSNGPADPAAVTYAIEAAQRLLGKVPIMGICLGHQAIGYAFGADVVGADRIMHGKTSGIINDGQTIFKGLSSPFIAGRYHSLILNRKSIPPCLEISAETEEGEVMGVRHLEYPVEGIQFHPEAAPGPGEASVLIKEFLERSLCPHGKI